MIKKSGKNWKKFMHNYWLIFVCDLMHEIRMAKQLGHQTCFVFSKQLATNYEQNKKAIRTNVSLFPQ